MENKTRICHLTSVHKRKDIRIFQKECKSLSADYDTHLVVADGFGNELLDQITIHDAGPKQKNRLLRFILTTHRVYQLAKKVNSRIYHFHDPELIPVGLLLRFQGCKVIYDIHEDVPRDMLSKNYLGIFKRPLSFLFEFFENRSAHLMSGLITATPHIRQRFTNRNNRTIDINNYPMLSEIVDDGKKTDRETDQRVAYIGAISRIRGLEELVKSLKYTTSKLDLAGEFESENFSQQLRKLPEWNRVIVHGHVDRPAVKKILERAIAGMVLFHPEPNHVNAQPNKIFEYMSAGIPVIASHFPLWKDILEKNECGLCVDPLDSKAIGDAINFLASHPEIGHRMGERGKQAVQEKFNWEIEERKLLHFYNLILNG